MAKATRWRTQYGDLQMAPFVVLVILGFAAFMAAFICIANVVSRHMTAQSCHEWGVVTGRPTKFASYNWWDYGCLTRTNNGKWIPTNQVQGYTKANG